MTQAPALVLLLALAVLVAGCGGDGDERTRVRRYIESVNSIERGAAPEVRRANAAYRSFAEGRLDAPAAVVQMRTIDERIRAVRDRFSALNVPREARALHGRLGALYDRILDFSRQTELLAVHVSGAEAALKPVARDNRELRRALSRAKGATGQANALSKFAGQLAGVIANLRELQPPRVLRVSHADQIRRLSHTRRLAVALRSALRARDADRVERLLARFDDAPPPRTGLARQAIRDYEDRYRKLSDARGDVLREYNRLDRELD